MSGAIVGSGRFRKSARSAAFATGTRLDGQWAGLGGGNSMSDSTVEVHDGAGVLIVEDEALVALFLEDTLDTLGYRCCGVADNAEEAVSLAQARRPALALVDVGLRGDRDGIALAADLTELGIAVVFLTGASDLETRRRAEAARPYGILSKPCSERDIALMLASAHLLSKQ
ncbi:MAG TPA: response regulator [Kiloniellaceae bacterium]